MKEMIYKNKAEKEILDNGKYKDYDYVIMSYGYHPCAYVRLPVDEAIKKDLDEWDIDVHGGITYADWRDFGFGLNFYIGWDYAHIGDYSGVCLIDPALDVSGDKKWKTEEIFEDVKSVIEQVIKKAKKVDE